MEHRIRVKKVCADGTEFSIEVLAAELDRALEDAFGSLRSFNAEMAKQGKCHEEPINE
jgi:hypothetical protein